MHIFWAKKKNLILTVQKQTLKNLYRFAVDEPCLIIIHQTTCFKCRHPIIPRIRAYTQCSFLLLLVLLVPGPSQAALDGMSDGIECPIIPMTAYFLNQKFSSEVQTLSNPAVLSLLLLESIRLVFSSAKALR